jgi:hypothetical protein
MSRNGSGVYSPPSANYPAVASTLITSANRNAVDADIATALTQSLAVDGQSTVTGNIPLAGFKLTGVGAATARTDAASLASIQDGTGVYVATVGGTADAITLTPSPAITAYVAGQKFWWLASGANTTAVTLQISGLANPKAVTKRGTIPLVANDIPSGAMVGAQYDGTQFQLISSNSPQAVSLLNTIVYSVVTQTVTMTIASPCVVTYTAPTGGTGHNFTPIAGSPIVFTTSGTLPTGLVAGTTYYVLQGNSANISNIAATKGGASINTSGSQSGTHTVNNPAYVKATNNPSYIDVEGVGSGGASGGASNAGGNKSIGGGGGGAYARKKILNATLGASETVTIGAPGIGGTTAGTNGGDGTDCTFGSLVTFKSGAGSNGLTGAGQTTGGSGGIPSSTNTDDVSLGRGENGGDGNNAVMYNPCEGGSSQFGRGGLAKSTSTTQSAPQDAKGLGAGASGFFVPTTTAQSGRDGYEGVIIVREYG